MPSGFKINMKPLQAALEKTRKEAGETRDEALDMAAEIVVSEAKQREVCPYLTGALADSHTWERGPGEGQRTVGANTTYAAAVHARHQTKAQWLLRTIAQRGPEIIRKATAKALKNRGIS